MLFFEKLNFQVFRFLGNFRAPGALLADSPENFSTERPVFVASPAPRVPKTWYARFFAQRLAKSKVQVFVWWIINNLLHCNLIIKVWWILLLFEKLIFSFSVLGGVFGLRDPSWRILRKISIPNAPFSWRLLPPASRKFGTQDFLLNVWRIPRCSFLPPPRLAGNH